MTVKSVIDSEIIKGKNKLMKLLLVIENELLFSCQYAKSSMWAILPNNSCKQASLLVYDCLHI